MLTVNHVVKYEDDFPGTQQYYCAGNVMPGLFDANATQIFYPSDASTGEPSRRSVTSLEVYVVK